MSDLEGSCYVACAVMEGEPLTAGEVLVVVLGHSCAQHRAILLLLNSMGISYWRAYQGLSGIEAELS